MIRAPSLLLAIALVVALATTGFARAQLGYEPSTSGLTWMRGFDSDSASLYSSMNSRKYSEALQTFLSGIDAMPPWLTSPVGVATLSYESVESENSPFMQNFGQYYEDFEYGYSYLVNAISQATSLGSAARALTTKHAVVSLVVFPRVVQLVEYAGVQCRRGVEAEDILVTWDTAWTLHVGRETSGVNNGWMTYTLAELRAKDAGTVVGGVSDVNKRLGELFTEGALAINNLDCPHIEEVAGDIKRKMLIPFVQGVGREAFRSDVQNCELFEVDDGRRLLSARRRLDDDCEDLNGKKKEDDGRRRRLGADPPDYQAFVSEGWTYVQALLPAIHQCSPAVATLLRNNFNLYAAKTSWSAAGWRTIVDQLHSVLPCLGLTCDEVGGYVRSGSQYYFLQCSPPPTTSPTKKPTTRSPTRTPTTSRPSRSPVTRAPTRAPTPPTMPTAQPTKAPTPPTDSPTVGPPTTPYPTKNPTNPTRSPTQRPSKSPTNPTKSPTRNPTKAPTTPTMFPTRNPTNPTNSPTTRPSKSPTLPTMRPTAAPSTSFPTKAPVVTTTPSKAPITHFPTKAPVSAYPTKSPSTSAPTNMTGTHSPTPLTPAARAAEDAAKAQRALVTGFSIFGAVLGVALVGLAAVFYRRRVAGGEALLHGMTTDASVGTLAATSRPYEGT